MKKCNLINGKFSCMPEYPYGKVPVLEWENKKLSQSFTIARFLAKQYKLTGADDFESAKCDEYADVVKDILKGG